MMRHKGKSIATVPSSWYCTVFCINMLIDNKHHPIAQSDEFSQSFKVVQELNSWFTSYRLWYWAEGLSRIRLFCFLIKWNFWFSKVSIGNHNILPCDVNFKNMVWCPCSFFSIAKTYNRTWTLHLSSVSSPKLHIKKKNCFVFVLK